MLQPLLIGGGKVDGDPITGRARMALPSTPHRKYADAQLDDYHLNPPRRGKRFTDSAPLRMTLRARASHPAPPGTLGFGFWNDPFSLPAGGGVLAAPNVIWFFYASPPSDMALAENVPGRGWKAATLNAGRIHPLILIPGALAAIGLTRIPGLGRPVMSVARRAVQAHEALLDDISLTEWREYELEWQADSAVFRVDGAERLRSPTPPRGPLGFVTWIDNQYALASREGKFGFGLCEVKEEQWLEIEGLRIEKV